MKKSLFFGCAVLAALVMFTACGDSGDPTSPPATPDTPSVTPPSPTPPVLITAKAFNLAVTTGDTAFKVAASNGALASSLKVYIKNDGTAVVITKAASMTGYTEASGNDLTVTQAGRTIVVTGLTAAASAGDNKTLDSDDEIPVTLAADAQTSQVSAITGLSKVPFVLSDATYTVAGSVSNTQNDIFLDAGYEIKIGNSQGNGTDDTTVDPDIDREVVTLLQSLQGTDTFTVDSSAVSAVVFTVAPSTDAFNTILGFEVPAITLGYDFTLTGPAAIPTGTALTVAVNKTLTISGGVVLTLDGGSIVLSNDGSTPAKIIFAGTGAVLSTGGSSGTGLESAGGVFVANDSSTQDVIPVSSFSELTITGGDGSLDSIEYTSGTNPWISGPKNGSGSGGTLSASTDCQS